MTEALKEQIATAVGRQPASLQALHGGNVARVYLAEMAEGPPLVIKTAGTGSDYVLEGFMLNFLTENSSLPVPLVHYADQNLLVLDWIESGDPIDENAERDAAIHLLKLHSNFAPEYGFECDTLIGPLAQPNPWTSQWIEFYRDHRLLYMARAAMEDGRLSPQLMARIDRLAEQLDRWIVQPSRPALLHGDMWGGNLLVKSGVVTGFIDPAIYYGDPEMDLAFATLFGTFREAFFESYEDASPLRPGFWEGRRDIYNLYPLLVHVRLFGGDYQRSVESILNRLCV